MVMNLAPLGVIAYGAVMAFISEFGAYMYIYRTSSFRTLKANLEKHAQKVEVAKDASTSRGVKKREARLQDWEDAASKQIASVQFKTSIIVMATVILSFRLLPRIFGTEAVATLPFHPPGFMQKIVQRGLPDADARDCSAMFLFMLCQGSVRAIVGKLLGWGPSRQMSEIKPKMAFPTKQA